MTAKEDTWKALKNPIQHNCQNCGQRKTDTMKAILLCFAPSEKFIQNGNVSESTRICDNWKWNGR